MIELQKKLYVVAKELKVNFTFNNRPISYEKVFATDGFLPAIAKRADQLCSLCLGYGLGLSLSEGEKSQLGIMVEFDDVTPNALRLVMISDVLIELMQVAPSRSTTPLDELMYD